MKMRAGCAVLAAMLAVCLLSGCQSGSTKAEKAAVKPDSKPQDAGVDLNDTHDGEQDQKFRTIRTRDPKTGRIITKQVPVKPSNDEQPKTRTVRIRDPKTGETIEKQVPINLPGKDQPKTRTVRTRDPKTGRAITKQVPVTTTSSKPTTPGECELTWSEKCTVRQAYDAIQALFYETLGLSKLPIGQGGSVAIDKISAKVRGRSANNVIFSVYVVFDAPDVSIITLKAEGKTQRSDILKKQTLFIRSKISEAIAKKPEVVDVKPVSMPYPKTLILDHSIDHVYSVVYGWQKNEKFRLDNRGYSSGKYYKRLRCSTGSGIDFSFSIRMIDVNKTKLVIDVKDFEGKDEFKMILKSLEVALKALEQPAEVGETAAEAGL